MRVLTINSVYNYGSTGKIAASIHKGLLNRGFVSSVAYGRNQPVNEPEIYHIGWAWEVQLHALQTRLLGTVGKGSVLGTVQLLRYMDKFKPDIVHLHNLHGYYINIFMLLDYINKRKIPVVWTLHDDWTITGRCGYFYECKKWENGCGKCPNLSEYPATLFIDRSADEWKLKKELFCSLSGLILVTPSQWLADDVRRSFLGEKRIEVIANGIDTQNIFYPRNRIEVRHKLGITQNQPVVLAVAPDFRNQQKGGKYVLEFARAIEKDSIKVMIIGWKGDASILPKNVIALPSTKNQKELAEYYSMADVFIITSLAENFPTVVLESLACGIPVVGFAVGGIPEQIKENCGMTVSPGDVEALRKGVISVISNSNSSIHDSCRAAAIEEYSSQVMIEKYIKIYKEGFLEK